MAMRSKEEVDAIMQEWRDWFASTGAPEALAAQEKVYSAIGRQQTTLAQVQGFSDPLNRDAEIAGAANRVYVAKADYDHFVAEYNSDASYVQWFLRVSHILPTRLPFAREVWR